MKKKSRDKYGGDNYNRTSANKRIESRKINHVAESIREQ